MTILTLKNRTNEPFTGMYDGVAYTLSPGATLTVPDFIAFHLKNQSVYRMNPILGDADYRLVIPELGDDETIVDAFPEEVLDRVDMNLNKTRIVRLGNRPPAPVHRVAGSAVTIKERESV